MILNFDLGRGKLLIPIWILTALASPDRSPRPAFLCGGLTRLCRSEGLMVWTLNFKRDWTLRLDRWTLTGPLLSVTVRLTVNAPLKIKVHDILSLRDGSPASVKTPRQ